MIYKVVCIKNLQLNFKSGVSNFVVGKLYNHWTNFGGLNYFVEDHNCERIPFKGLLDNGQMPDETEDDRLLFSDYFKYTEEWRDDQISKIIK